jgi:hypothetical protein
MSGDPKTLEIRVPGAPDFAPQIEALLKKAGIKNTSAARSALESSLQLAWGDFHYERKHQIGQPSPELLKQLKNSIRKTRALLAKLEQFQVWNEIGCDFCPVDDLTVSIARVPQTLELRRNPPPLGHFPDQIPPHGLRAAINRKRILDRLVRELNHFYRKRKRGNQPEPDKDAIVTHAGIFFREHSPERPTAYFNGTFFEFCRSFYKVATGQLLRPESLAKAIRKEVTKPSLRTQMPQKR